jgi:hypothetical protein
MMPTDTWEENLAAQKRRGFINYSVEIIDLGVARTNELHHVPGDILYVNTVSSKSASATVRFNLTKNNEVELKHHTKIETVFTSLFISNEVQAGESMELVIGINFKVSNLNIPSRCEVQPVITITHASADTNVAGAAHPCNTAIIKADVKNMGIAWVDFGKAAVQDACYPLDPGEWIRADISNTDRINANFEVGGEKVFVAYEV